MSFLRIIRRACFALVRHAIPDATPSPNDDGRCAGRIAMRYCCDPEAVHDDEIMRIEDASSFGRSRIEPLALMPP